MTRKTIVLIGFTKKENKSEWLKMKLQLYYGTSSLPTLLIHPPCCSDPWDVWTHAPTTCLFQPTHPAMQMDFRHCHESGSRPKGAAYSNWQHVQTKLEGTSVSLSIWATVEINSLQTCFISCAAICVEVLHPTMVLCQRCYAALLMP